MARQCLNRTMSTARENVVWYSQWAEVEARSCLPSALAQTNSPSPGMPVLKMVMAIWAACPPSRMVLTELRP